MITKEAKSHFLSFFVVARHRFGACLSHIISHMKAQVKMGEQLRWESEIDRIIAALFSGENLEE